MATSFPQEIQTFPTMQDMSASDAELVKQYQELMKQGRVDSARAILAQISNYQNKLVTAELLNTMNDTIVALEGYYTTRFSPAYIVSATQPTQQDTGDFWFRVDKETSV